MSTPASSRPPVRLALLGAGRWGRIYLRTISAMPDVALTVVASSNPATAALVPAGCRVVASWRDAIAAPDVDAVIVATQPALHVEMALAAVSAGRPVLVEKPLSLALTEAEELQRAAAARAVLVVVEHTHLYSAAFRALVARARGSIRAVQANTGNPAPPTDAPVLWNWGSHLIAMCLQLFGSAPSRAEASWLDRREVGGLQAEQVRVRLTFGDDVGADMSMGNLVPERVRRFVAHTETETLVYDDLAPAKLTSHPPADIGARLGDGAPVPFEQEPPLTCAVREFAAQVRAGDRRQDGLALGVAVVRVLEQCQRSLS